jgi:hypothetical protein
LQKILNAKAKCIKEKKASAQKYTEFLEEVRAQNSDEFSEVSLILARYNTLKDS